MADFKLTTVARCKARLGDQFVADTDIDADMQLEIDRVDALAKSILGRSVDTAQHVEYHQVEQYETDIYLAAFPIDLDQSIMVRMGSRRVDIANQTTLSTLDYDVIPDLGRIVLESQAPYDPTHVEVTYTGGMAADFDAFALAYPSIVRAVEDQVLHQWGKRRNPGRTVTLRSGSVEVDPEVSMLKTVRQTLTAYRRWNVA